MMKKTQNGRNDRIAHLIEQRRRETPDIPLDGMEIFARARWLTLLSRPQIEAIFARHGIDTGEFDVLATLRRAGKPYALRPTKLFQTLMISSGGLTARLNRLEKRGLVSRTPSPTDKRSMIVQLSEEGRELIDKAFAEDMRVEREMLASLSEEERDILATLLAKILSAMEPDRQGDDPSPLIK